MKWVSLSVWSPQVVQEPLSNFLVVANLTATLLTHMAADLAGHVSDKGLLLLSGILAEQVEEVAKCFQAHYFKVVENRA